MRKNSMPTAVRASRPLTLPDPIDHARRLARRPTMRASWPPTQGRRLRKTFMEIRAACILQKTALMDSISLPVVSPAFERLKRNGVWLHSLAATLLLAHALSHFRSESTHTLYFWCLLFISIDIFLLVLAGRDLLGQLPRVNLFFRCIEIIFFFCIGVLMIHEGNELTGIIHFLLTIGYSYLFYCESALRQTETLSFHHTGITIPSLPESRFLYWTHVNGVNTTYDHINILTSEEEELEYSLRINLDYDQLEHVKAFCHHYLGQC